MCNQHHNIPTAPQPEAPRPSGSSALSAGGAVLSRGLVDEARALVGRALEAAPAPKPEPIPVTPAQKPAPIVAAPTAPARVEVSRPAPAPAVLPVSAATSVPSGREATATSVAATLAPTAPVAEVSPESVSRKMRFHLNKAWRSKIAQRRGLDITLKGGHVVRMEIVGSECELTVVRLNGSAVVPDSVLISSAEDWLNR